MKIVKKNLQDTIAERLNENESLDINLTPFDVIDKYNLFIDGKCIASKNEIAELMQEYSDLNK